MLTSQEVLGQAEVRRAQGFLKLVEAAMVVLALQVTLDGLQHLFHFLESGVEAGDLVLAGKLLEELDLAVGGLGILASEFTEDVVGSLVDALNAVAQVGKLLLKASVDRGCLLLLLRNDLLLSGNGLLVGVLLLDGHSAACSRLGGLENELEDFEGVGVLGGCGGKTKDVAGRESDLLGLGG